MMKTSHYLPSAESMIILHIERKWPKMKLLFYGKQS